MGSTQGKAEIKAPGRMKIGEKIIVFPHLGSNVWKTEREGSAAQNPGNDGDKVGQKGR